MPRPKRIHLKQVLYFITLRVVEGRPLFADEKDLRCYLKLLEEYNAQYQIELYAYLLKADSILLCVEPRTDEGTISEFMHALSSRYTKLANSRHGVQGHLFRARFRSTLAEKRTHLVPLTAYIHAKANLFNEAPDAVMASSWKAYAAGKPQCPLTHDALEDVRALFSENFPGRDYPQWVEALNAGELGAMEKVLKQPVLGSDAFVAKVKALMQGKPEATPARPEARKTGAASKPLVKIVRPIRRFSTKKFAGVFVGAGMAALFLAVAPQINDRIDTVRFSAEEASTPSGTDAEMNRDVRMAQVHSVPDIGQSFMDLNGSAWEIKLVPRRDSMTQTERFDKIAFDTATMQSGFFSEEGFNKARYTQQPGSDALHWEGIQAGASGKVIYWEGVVKGQLVKGSIKVDGPETKDRFDFVGVMLREPKPRRVEL